MSAVHNVSPEIWLQSSIEQSTSETPSKGHHWRGEMDGSEGIQRNYECGVTDKARVCHTTPRFPFTYDHTPDIHVQKFSMEGLAVFGCSCLAPCSALSL